VVSVHDIAPSTLAEVRWLLAALDRIGIGTRVLKVVPAEDGTRDLRTLPEFGPLLRDEVSRGSEVVLHGFSHRTAGPLRGALWDRARARLFGPDAAEFLSIDEETMRRRISEGTEILGDLGLEPRGFCAPGWLASPQLTEVLGTLGFRYDLRFGSVRDLERGRCLRIPGFGYMGAGPRQERLVGIEARLVRAAWSRAAFLRVFLHPQGAPQSRACHDVLEILTALARRRRPATYLQVLNA
jgi:predicted deacetylase